MRRTLVLILVVCVAAAFGVGYLAKDAPTAQPASIVPSPSAQAPAFYSVHVMLPAVDNNGQGALAELAVEVSNGTGQLYISFADSPMINEDTQSSLRIALAVAERESGVSSKKVNVYYTIMTSSDTVGGKSAGAAATIATILALKGEQLKPGSLITGTIEPDGKIGQVGKVLEKAKAAAAAGYTLFVVPKGEATQKVAVTECSEKKTETPSGWQVSKSCVQTIRAADVAKESGIQIVEADNVTQAYQLLRAS